MTAKYVLFFVFFNDTATTEIYTDGHTLALQDALPIARYRRGLNVLTSRQGPGGRRHRGLFFCTPAMRRRGGLNPLPPPGWAYAGAIRFSVSSIRSEEHTSELQSLMRISYAVFCLNKKKHTKTNYI